jgi:hypothetical protein
MGRTVPGPLRSPQVSWRNPTVSTGGLVERLGFDLDAREADEADGHGQSGRNTCFVGNPRSL